MASSNSARGSGEASTSDSSEEGLLPRLRAHARQLRRRMRPSTDMGVADRLANIDEQFVEEGARDVTESDIETVVEKADAIEQRFREGGPLHRIVRDGRLLLAFVKDAYEGRYRAVPVWTLSAVVFTLLYVLNPFDLIPEAVPVIGLLDDAAVVSACLVLVEQDLHEYSQWREQTAQTQIGDDEATDESKSLTSG